jgi:hypothetical protein
MANTAPVEVWEKILKYAISVALFFDPDPIVNHGLNHLSRYCFEGEYWDSERIRNSLRRVCRSWNTFLQPYNHRYVRLSDIYNGWIPKETIAMAIRLNISPHPTANEDISTTYIGTSQLFMSYLSRNGENRGLVREWRTEILEGELVVDPQLFVRWINKALHLRVVLNSPPFGQEKPPEKARLRLLYANPTWIKPSSEVFSLQHLTTLYLRSFSKNISFENWRLPALKHLSLQSISDSPYGNIFNDDLFSGPAHQEGFGEKMMEIVRVMGENLLTLHYQGSTSSPLPDIWPYVPVAQHIQIPCWAGVSIPVAHPARVVTVRIRSLARFLLGDNPVALLFDYIPPPPILSVRSSTVRMDITWFVALTQTTIGFFSTPLVKIAIWLAHYYEDNGIKFTDSEGVTLNNHLIFLISLVWRGRQAKRVRKMKTCAVLTF